MLCSKAAHVVRQLAKLLLVTPLAAAHVECVLPRRPHLGDAELCVAWQFTQLLLDLLLLKEVEPM